jgi:DNA-binding NarL/FixJ family response regulator
MMEKPTRTPWALFHSNGVIAIRNPRSRSSHNEIVFWSGFDASHYPKQALANATLIVKAVNSHDDLLKALQDIADTDQYADSDDTAAELREIARNAIAKASNSDVTPDNSLTSPDTMGWVE